MKKLNIAVYAICKNEESFVESWMKSMSEADSIIVTDTGSTDNTITKLRELGAIVHEEVIKPWRFDHARNKSLSHVPSDVDICVCTDLDELLEPGWRKLLEEYWNRSLIDYPSNGRIIRRKAKYLYNWSLKADGTPDVQFYYTKIHERVGFRWKCPIHEFIEYVAKEPIITVEVPGMVLNHYPDSTKSRGSYLHLLELAVQEDTTDDRMRYYLGREYMYLSRSEDCIKTCKEHLMMPNAIWSDERCASMRLIAKSYERLGNSSEAYRWYFKAIVEQPSMRDPYVEGANYALSQKDWSLALLLVKEALKITEKSKTFVNAGYAWDATPYDCGSNAAYYLGLYEDAYELASKALEYDPSNTRLIQNLDFCKRKVIK